MDAFALDVWGGVEYTRNRVKESYLDQMDLSGHACRPGDIESIAELGVRTLRLGLLWERHEERPDWTWPDAMLRYVQDAGMMPIAGLVHHGSGPKHTNLLDAEFAPKVARYAGKLAARYPWINAYTPINEPNTTARFSCRYGLWYPHAREESSYLRALLNQTKATVLAMRAVRAVQSEARLVQTEDAGRFWSTSELAATCDLMNERRWLTFDLLCGTVDRDHALYGYLCGAGLTEAEVLWFADHPCPPEVVGLNYYVTSDRFLDHRVELYPRSCRSAEGGYVDVEAVRVRGEGIAGFASPVLEAWRRYGLPVALTEVHLGSTVAHQMRWALEAWEGALRARAQGANCVAITFWALMGSFYWNELVTRANGHYEAGAFDVRSGRAEPTRLAGLITELARGVVPAPEGEGWWREPGRIEHHAPLELLPV